MEEGRQLLLQGGNLSVRDPRTCGSGWRFREQEMDWPPLQTSQYPEGHCNPEPWHCWCSNQTRTQTDCRCSIQTYSLLRWAERDVDCPPTSSALGRRNHCQRYHPLFAIAPYVRRKCSTSKTAGELCIKYRQLEPGNDDTASRIAATAWQLEWRQEDIDAATHNQEESRDAKKQYFDQAAILWSDDLHIGNLALIHNTKIEQSHCTTLDARWYCPYRVTEIVQSLGTYPVAEQNGAELEGCIDGSRLEKFVTRHEDVNGTEEGSPPRTAQVKELEEVEVFELQAVAGRKYMEGQWMNEVTWKDWEKWSSVQVEITAGSKELGEKWNAPHLVPEDHLSKQWWDRWMEGARQGGWRGGWEEIHCMDHNENSWESIKSIQLRRFAIFPQRGKSQAWPHRCWPNLCCTAPHNLTGQSLPAAKVAVLMTITPRMNSTWAASYNGLASTPTARECFTIKWRCWCNTREKWGTKLYLSSNNQQTKTPSCSQRPQHKSLQPCTPCVRQ